ncbi:MAG TPA: FtsQ-type POTRA domain-containing protein [Candidatus Angelobacter sp.]|nr:FtsQ-type POTRA domain-containing protein [Candidatus Angelobacter sp.]
MSSVLEDSARRQARARATAASIIDAPRIARRFALPEESPLRSTGRRRTHRSEMPRFLPNSIGAISRRRVAVVVLAVQLVALLAILALPVFRAKSIAIAGNHLVARAAVLDAAHLSTSQSLFTVDGEQVRQRIEKLPWVRSASVETELPSTVRITIREWTPVLMLHTGSRQLAIADSGDVLDLGKSTVAAPPGVPTLVDNRPAFAAAQLSGSGKASVDPVLVRTLVVTAQRFPAAFGVGVNHFEWQSDGLFAIVTTAGWRAVLGHMLSDQDIAAVPDQLASLLSLKGKLDFARPTFGYVDLENPSAPAVGGKPAPADAPAAAPATSAPSSSATPAPTPKSTATPTPAPTPIQFSIGRPTP